MRVYRKRRLKRWFERFLLLTGVLALDIWIWSQAVPALYEAW